MFYDSVTTQIRQSYEYSADSAGLYEYGKIQLRYAKLYWEIRQESVKNTPKRLRIIYESSTKKGNSWQFLTIREIFSLKLGIKCNLPLLGHYFQNKCSSESCWCIGSTLECSGKSC